MKRKIARLLILGLLTATGFSILVMVSEARRCPKFTRRLVRTILLQPYSPGSDVDFKWQMSASGNTPDGGRFDDSQYMSTDCIKVSVTYYSFSSVMAARSRFDTSLETARKVYAKSSGSDTDANPSDRRIVFVGPSNGLYEILHRNGNRLLQIESSSLNHALEYERRLGIQNAQERQ